MKSPWIEGLRSVALTVPNLSAAERFYTDIWRLEVADSGEGVVYLRGSGADHHTLAIGDSDNSALNHIAFVVPTLNCVMRGGGRMKDAGHAIQWGPGRHGPGDNAFNYFIDPFGIVIEYTAEVEQIDASYQPGGPTDWTWPAGRVDQWGIAAPPSAELKQAQRLVPFSTTEFPT
jgi:catechol 2,3-dioxygenase